MLCPVVFLGWAGLGWRGRARRGTHRRRFVPAPGGFVPRFARFVPAGARFVATLAANQNVFFIITGGTLTLQDASITATAALGGIFTNSSDGDTISSPMTLSGTTSLSLGSLHSVSLAGAISGGGAVVFDIVPGTSSLPATGNLSGVGTLSGSGKSLFVLGSRAPGNSAGTITVGSGFTLDLSQSGTSAFEITDPAFTAGSHDLVSGSGSVVFGGVLSVVLSGGTLLLRRRRGAASQP